MRRLALLSLVSLAAACLASCLDGSGERTGVLQRSIFHGTVDTQHPAVMASFSNFSQCTATVIAVTGNRGFALTAAHCCTQHDHPTELDQGVDDNNPDRIYPVTAWQADPAYNGSVHDFCMLQFSGADGTTPVIPAMTPADDNLVVGSVVEFVGYGITETNMNNSQRRTFTGPINKLDALTVTYPQTLGGPCEGDSGGPSLSVVNGRVLVSSVTSYGDAKCTSYGVSGRTSGGWTSFIQPFLVSHGFVPAVDGGAPSDLTPPPPPPSDLMPPPPAADLLGPPPPPPPDLLPPPPPPPDLLPPPPPPDLLAPPPPPPPDLLAPPDMLSPVADATTGMEMDAATGDPSLRATAQGCGCDVGARRDHAPPAGTALALLLLLLTLRARVRS